MENKNLTFEQANELLEKRVSKNGVNDSRTDNGGVRKSVRTPCLLYETA